MTRYKYRSRSRNQ